MSANWSPIRPSQSLSPCQRRDRPRKSGFLSDLLAFLRVLRALQKEAQRHWQSLIYREHWQRRGVEIAPSALVRLSPGADLQIGEGTVVGPFTILDLLADPLGSPTMAPKLVIGRGVAINEFNNIRASGGSIRIGDHCLVSQFVSIIASNHSIDVPTLIRDAPWDPTKNWVEVGAGVWIGTYAIILPGVRVGEGSVVAAGAVVTHDVPDYTIVAGQPARVIRRGRCVPAEGGSKPPYTPQA
jgi:acetyltransferase-like isoleucine patch superfamily enzyme